MSDKFKTFDFETFLDGFMPAFFNITTEEVLDVRRLVVQKPKQRTEDLDLANLRLRCVLNSGDTVDCTLNGKDAAGNQVLWLY